MVLACVTGSSPCRPARARARHDSDQPGRPRVVRSSRSGDASALRDAAHQLRHVLQHDDMVRRAAFTRLKMLHDDTGREV